MKNIHFTKYTDILKGRIIILLILPLLFTTNSCEKLLEVDSPPTSLLKSQVYSDNSTAEAALRGVYSTFMNPYYCTGFQIAWRTGLSADELTFNYTDPSINMFKENDLVADNSYISQYWTYAYTTIYRANDVIQGLNNSTGISETAKSQFIGEALFIRSFLHFYLVNLFGDIPYVTSTDYIITSKMERAPVSSVYLQIESDLKEAIELLSSSYPTSGRYRVNKSVALSLLSRVYLYQEKWIDAESAASTVIGNSADYSLVPLSGITLPGNKEAIWQIYNFNNNSNTSEGEHFYGASSTMSTILSYFSLRDEFVGNGEFPGVFGMGDLRKTDWIRTNRKNFLMSYKYRSYSSTATTNPDDSRKENSTVFRLAEQYLIRAEARAQQNKLDLAISDVDAIRERAGLPLIANTNPSIGKADLLDAIMHERRVELFTEWGHRWFDLKRTGLALTVLSPIKSGLTQNDLLYPIPQSELIKNPFLEQNPGY